jgi:hypothetical protein
MTQNLSDVLQNSPLQNWDEMQLIYTYILVAWRSENYIMRSLMICTSYPILCGW